MAISLHSEPAGEPGGWGGCFTWDPGGGIKESSRNGPLHRGPVGEPGGGAHPPGASRERDGGGTWKQHLSLWQVRGTWRGGSFNGDPGYVNDGSGNRHLSP